MHYTDSYFCASAQAVTLFGVPKFPCFKASIRTFLCETFPDWPQVGELTTSYLVLLLYLV